MNRKQIVTCSSLLIFFLFIGFSQNDMLVVNNSFQTSPIVKDFDVTALTVGNAVFTWTARDSPTPSEFLTDEIEGDHITIHVTSTDPPVTESQLFVNSWRTDSIALSERIDDGFNPYSDKIQISDEHFDWLLIGGLELGTSFHLVCNFDTSNCDVMVWRGDSDTSNWYYSNNVLQTSMATVSNPEMCHLDWPVDNQHHLYFAFYNHDMAPGMASLEFYMEEYPKRHADEETVIYDTYGENFNVIKPVLYVAKVDVDSYSYGYLHPTSFVNYFPPEVELLTPVAGDNWNSGLHNITWTATDRNSDDALWFELYLQSGEPDNYIELGTGEFNYDSQQGFYYHTIDATGVQNENYAIRIVAHDNDTTIAQDWPDLQDFDESGLFLFGNVFVSTTVLSSTNTTTTSSTQTPLNFILFVN
ncbi:MAG: hypothetical protein MUP60_04190, partial [Candidatus Thorarchaeota archaeon]|nr:hypothetical protein [Candidatus Thorarchaeota archaeon]